MLDYLRKVFSNDQTSTIPTEVNSYSNQKNRKVEIAACALIY